MESDGTLSSEPARQKGTVDFPEQEDSVEAGPARLWAAARDWGEPRLAQGHPGRRMTRMHGQWLSKSHC